MIRKRWLIALLTITMHHPSYCQITFELILPPPPKLQTPPPPFVPEYSSSTSFTDVDGDHDQDLLVIGRDGAALYTNDGAGIYTKVDNTPFQPVYNQSFAFADIDGDDDQDVLLTGFNSNDSLIAVLYVNDGKGQYTSISNPPFPAVYASSVAFSDVDGDSDQDVLMAGIDSSSAWITKLYLNDGYGNYSESNGTSFEGVRYSSIAFADVDGDNDQDVLISGENAEYYRSTILYTNDGMGDFIKVSDSPFQELEGAVAFADVDGDHDQDIVIKGVDDTTNDRITMLYVNDGAGAYNESHVLPFTDIAGGSIAFADIDNDGDADILTTGSYDRGYHKVAMLYTNDGKGNYDKVDNTSFMGVSGGSINFADIDGDNDFDVLIYGYDEDEYFSITLYSNDGAGNFTEVNGSYFQGASSGSVAFADVDGDNDKDVLITGDAGNNTYTGTLYLNSGGGSYTAANDLSFWGVQSPRLTALADVDNDNDQDVLITGYGERGYVASFHINDGEGNFTEVIGTPFPSVSPGSESIAFADIDGDDDQDVLVAGDTSYFDPITILYTNDGQGNYTEVVSTPFHKVAFSSVAFADIDGDNDEDVLITGNSSISTPNTSLYVNDGLGNYTEVTDTPFVDVGFGSTAFADVDNDGDQDVLITGRGSNGRVAKLYINNGTGTYAEATDTPFVGVSGGSVAFSDLDLDNDQDLLVTGYTDNNNSNTSLYVNDGAGNYSEVKGTPFLKVSSSSIAFADIDGDNDQDVLIAGRSEQYKHTALLYRNVSCQAAPVADAQMLPTLSGTCTIEAPMAPTATDECEGKITGTTNTEFPITDASINHVVWTYTDSQGNRITQSQAVKLSNPEVNITASGDTLTASPDNATYQWLDCNDDFSVITGETRQSFVASQNGSYAVEVTQDGCSEMSECIDMIVLGIVKNTFRGKVALYPNPTRGLVTVTLDRAYPDMQVIVRSATGQVVQQQRAGYVKVLTLDINQPKGVYLVTVTSEAYQAVIRLVKK